MVALFEQQEIPVLTDRGLDGLQNWFGRGGKEKKKIPLFM